MVEAAAFNSKLPSDLRLAAAASATRRLVTPPTLSALFVLFSILFQFLSGCWEKTDSNQLMRLHLFVTEHVLSAVICISLQREADVVQRGPALILIPPNNNPANGITKGYYVAGLLWEWGFADGLVLLEGRGEGLRFQSRPLVSGRPLWGASIIYREKTGCPTHFLSPCGLMQMGAFVGFSPMKKGATRRRDSGRPAEKNDSTLIIHLSW